MQLSSQTLSLSEKLNLLADAAKYDVACTSSGVNRAGKQGQSRQFGLLRYLPQLFFRRTLYLSVENSAEQRLYLRL